MPLRTLLVDCRVSACLVGYSPERVSDQGLASVPAGGYSPRSQLPSYNEFAAHYRVAFTTIARVIADMRADGVVVVGVPGPGVFVAES